MAKRRAEYQIDRDGGHLDVEAKLQKEAEEQNLRPTGLIPGGVQGRKIAKLRTNKFGSNPSTTNESNGSTGGFSFFGAKKPTTTNTSEDENLAKFKAINTNFVNKINESFKKDPSCILSNICEKYLEYANQNKKTVDSKLPTNTSATSAVPNFTFNTSKPVEQKQTPFANFKANTSNNSNISGNMDSNKKNVAVEETDKPKHNPFGQFKFTKPAAEKASITELPSSDSESESDKEVDNVKKPVEIKGPQFTLTAKPIVKNPTFAFGEALKKKQAAEIDSDDSDVAEEPKGPTFNFTGTINDSTFKFTKKEEENEKKDVPATTTAVVAATPTFSFGTKKPEEETSKPTENNNKPAFSFGITSAPLTKKTEELPKPATTAPVFNFGAKKDTTETKTTAPVFNFGAKQQDSTTSKPTFSFGLNKSEAKKEETNTAIEKAPEAKPQFSFNLNNKAPASETTKPTFNFGNTNTTAATTSGKVGFGNTTSFSFGKKDEDKTADSSETNKPNFTFNLPFNQNKTAPTPTIATPAATPGSVPQPPKTETTAVSEQDEGGKQETPNLENSEEENENVLYTKKAKLMLFQPDNKETPYLTKGLGMFKILQSKEDKKKVRFLLRSEGMGHVILNTYILPSVNYEQFPSQPSAVKLPIVNGETKKFETFLLRVKTGDDGKDIVNVINKAKEDMK